MSDANKAVFLSYASQDAEAARRVCEALRSGGVEVWFDADGGLEHGDEWDAKIRRQIKECVLFIPLISANTQARHEGYFRLEWELAAERAMSIASGVAFILPVIIDDTREPDALVPDRFRKVQWTRLPGGVTAPEVQQRFLKLWSHRVGLVSHEDNRMATAAGGSSSPLPEVAAKLSHVNRIAVVAVALVTLASAGWWIFQQTKTSAPVAPVSPAKTEEKKSVPAATPSAQAASEKSVVVLPFENLSTEPNNAAFVDGTLSQLGDVKVISRNSALALKGSTLSLAEIGQKLGVANVITGNVRREADRVRIQLELRRASDEAVLWTKIFDQQLTDVFAIQNEIATEVARVLQARDRRGTNAGAQFMTKDPRAYELFVKLRQEYDSAPAGALSEDYVRRLEELVQMDPKFMPAVSMLATMHVRIFMRDSSSAAGVRHAAEAKRWAETASVLMPGGAGDGALAYYHDIVTGDYAQGLVFAQNAVRALPNDATGYNFSGIALINLGRAGEAVAAADRALELDPFNSLFQNNRLNYLVAARRREAFATAVAQWKAAHENSPPPNYVNLRYTLDGELPPEATGDATKAALGWLWQARRFTEMLARIDAATAGGNSTDVQRYNWLSFRTLALRRLARKSEAAEAAQLTLAAAERLPGANEINPNQTFASLAFARMLVGRGEEAAATIRRSIETARATGQIRLAYGREILLATILAEAGRTRECTDLLAKLLRVPCGLTVPMLRVSPDWDNVRSDPAFRALLADPKNDAPL